MRWRRRVASSTAGTTRNAGEHDGEFSNENCGDTQPRSLERSAENGEDHRRKILTKNGVKSRGNRRHRCFGQAEAPTGMARLLDVATRREIPAVCPRRCQHGTSGLLALVSSTVAGYFVFSGEAGFGLGWF
ncbi:hypothetical protein TIFTF001_018392 [Ficus carica]|uniref:Uncharacterized protein n=1 Tax=Ficus carica TaxID=3494 RepID=A0AA88ABA2_FICCA|nr:hypothetical protein TIFTF001_018392 [Ficus carica]